MLRKTHTINAEGQAPGRLATQIVSLLRGKNRPEFVPYKDDGDIVYIENVSQMKYTGKKVEQKKYYRYTGYPGGLKDEGLKKLVITNPKKVLFMAVKRMLPDNKLRNNMLKRLIIK